MPLNFFTPNFPTTKNYGACGKGQICNMEDFAAQRIAKEIKNNGFISKADRIAKAYGLSHGPGKRKRKKKKSKK